MAPPSFNGKCALLLTPVLAFQAERPTIIMSVLQHTCALRSGLPESVGRSLSNNEGFSAARRDTGMRDRVPRGSPAGLTLQTCKAIPRTPLEVTLAKLQQAEAEHLKDKVQTRRDLDQQRRRASSLEHRYTQLQVGFARA